MGFRMLFRCLLRITFFLYYIFIYRIFLSFLLSCYSIYIAGLVFEWLLEQGGLVQIEKMNIAKANLLYEYFDSTQFYHSPVHKADRSRMNVPFWLQDEALNEKFLSGAQQRGLLQLKGHRSVGGMRASIYNAMPIEGVRTLVDYLKEFERSHG